MSAECTGAVAGGLAVLIVNVVVRGVLWLIRRRRMT